MQNTSESNEGHGRAHLAVASHKQQIDNHYAYYWANDRLSAISMQNQFLNALPRQIKRHIIMHYLFDDIYYRFRPCIC